MMDRINVTKTFLPPLEEYEKYLEKIWANGLITNQGVFLNEFQQQIEKLTKVDNFHFVSNGTTALQLALRALDITEGDIITTPFSYVATTSSILWERCHPVFVDIDPATFCIDHTKIEKAITKDTKAIMAVHVFGNPCAVESIEAIAKKHNLKVIYDGAHAFGVKYKDKSIFSYGDITTCSFHATKLLHTIEGGGVFARDIAVSEKIELIKRFGHNGDDHFTLGINAKASEFQAAMGLVNLQHLDKIMDGRRRVFETYDQLLDDSFARPAVQANVTPNYAYYPLVFSNEAKLMDAFAKLKQINVFPRRYFYPSLNKLPYVTAPKSCPISEDIASRIACLPLYLDLQEASIIKICEVINS